MNKPSKVLVEVFASPNCNRCGQATRLVSAIVDKLGNEHIQWREINVVEDIDYAVQLGVLATPAIAINGKLEFTSLPGGNKLSAILQDYLNDPK
jgi:thioredoxin 1